MDTILSLENDIFCITTTVVIFEEMTISEFDRNQRTQQIWRR